LASQLHTEEARGLLGTSAKPGVLSRLLGVTPPEVKIGLIAAPFQSLVALITNQSEA